MGAFLTALLESYGYDCSYFESAETFLESKPLQNNFFCLLIDWKLPGISGIELVQLVKNWTPRPPIMMITAVQSEEELARSLHSGADDFITKPVNRTLFLARFRALMRRYDEIYTLSTGTQAGIALNLNTLELVTIAGERCSLSLKELLILDCLNNNIGNLVTRDTLLELLADCYTNEDRRSNLDLSIFRLRKKLQTLHSVRVEIKTIYKKGYKLVVYTN